MMKNAFLVVKNMISIIISIIKNISAFVRSQFNSLKEDFNIAIFRVKNMTSSNINLGVHHLYNGNYSDAIFRLKLVDKLLDPQNKVANYFLGWTYLLKGNYQNSIMHFVKSKEEDKINSLNFVKSINSINIIPRKIYENHRNITANILLTKLSTDIEKIPRIIVTELTNAITNSSNSEYEILDLGSNIGFLGYEIKERFSFPYNITGVEISKDMIELHSTLFKETPENSRIYNRVIHSPVDEFLVKSNHNFDIICSMNGFAFDVDLQTMFNHIFAKLNPNGYFAFAIKSAENNMFIKKNLEFVYNSDDTKSKLIQAGFKILFSQEFSLEIKNNFFIFVCTK